MVWVGGGLAVLLASAAAAAGPSGDVRAWRKAHEAEIVRELADSSRCRTWPARRRRSAPTPTTSSRC